MRELRHDFRACYHVGYDDVPTDEAIDLIETLPAGSMWRAARDPVAAWGAERHRHADVIDAIDRVAWALGLWDRSAMPEPPRVARPADEPARAADAARRAEVRRRIHETRWEEA